MIEDGGGRYTATNPPKGFSEIPAGHTLVESIDVHGKFMWWTLVNQNTGMYFYMHCTYGMSGQWRKIWIDEDGGCDWPGNVSFSVRYDDPNEFPSKTGFLHFVDQRHFGTIKFVYDLKEHEKKLKSFGLDHFETFTYEDVVERIKKHGKKTLAELLMSQTAVFAGIGNYLKAEILYACRLSPHRLVETLSDAQILLLFNSTVVITQLSYSSLGASFRTYRNSDGANGNFSSQMQVYGREISVDGHKVITEETKDKRTTHWCPSVQL